MLVDWKKNTQHESCELSFIQGLTEDGSLGDSLSDSSEILFQRGRGEASLYVIFLMEYTQSVNILVKDYC